MSRKNRNTLADRVIKAAEAALAAQDYVSPIDVLVRIGWLDAGSVERWRLRLSRLDSGENRGGNGGRGAFVIRDRRSLDARCGSNDR